MRRISLALDWSPNTLHAGFYLALLKGWYLENEMEVTIVNPEDDNYKLTPAKQLANGMVHFAIAPTESVISYRTLSKSIPLVAVAAVLQKDTSAIVSLQSSQINTPKELDGKSYASYGARYEDCIVKKLIQNDGGCGMLQVLNPEKLGIWDTLLNGEADSTWVFLPWEGVLAKKQGVDLTEFKLSDFNIPYGYSPLLITTEGILEEYPECVKKFLALTAKGFAFVANNPKESAAFLHENIDHENFADVSIIEESLAMLSDKWLLNKKWGMMQDKVWDDFVNWLVENRVLCNLDGEALTDLQLNMKELYTNSYLTH